MLVHAHVHTTHLAPPGGHSLSGLLCNRPQVPTPRLRSLREEGTTEGRPPRDLVYCTPEESLQAVVDRLFAAHCSMAPVLSKEPESMCGHTGGCTFLVCLFGVHAE